MVAMKTLFVSYSRNDREAVARLTTQLQEGGYTVWHDQKLTGGQKWWDNILAEIRSCDIFIFALSAGSVDSEACRSELHYAISLGKTPLPVLVADNVRLQNLARPLSELQVVDYRQQDMAATLEVIKAINLAPASGPPPDPLPPAPVLPVSYLGSLSDKIDSRRTLTDDEQYALCTQLAIARSKGHSGEEIREMAGRLMRRPDLLASVKDQVIQTLATFEGAGRGKPRTVAVTSEPSGTPVPTSDDGCPESPEAMFRRYATRIAGDGVYCRPEIPEHMLLAAMGTLECVEPQTAVLVLFEHAGRKQSNVWLITQQGFYRQNFFGAIERFEWASLYSLVVSTTLLHRSITVNDGLKIDLPQWSPEAVQSLGALLLEIRSTLGAASSAVL
jgi:hypothetical protein